MSFKVFKTKTRQQPASTTLGYENAGIAAQKFVKKKKFVWGCSGNGRAPGLRFDSKRIVRFSRVTSSGNLPPAAIGSGVTRASGSIIYRDPRGRLPVPPDAWRASAESP